MTDSEKLDLARRHYQHAQAETMEMYGLNHSIGLLYGSMLFRYEPITLDDMCKETGMSKTSMSTGVRELARLQLVRKRFQSGVRKDLYEVERDQFVSFVKFFTRLWRRAVELNEEGIRGSEKEIQALLDSGELGEEVQQKAQRDIEVLRQSKRYYEWLTRLYQAFENGDIGVPMPEGLLDEEGKHDEHQS